MAGLLRQLDFTGEELRLLDAELSTAALAEDERGQAVRRLMTIPGVDAAVALAIVAAVGDFHRFGHRRSWSPTSGCTRGCASPGGRPAMHGPITKAGPAHFRSLLVDPAWAASTTPGPLRAFYQRIRGRRGQHRCRGHRPQAGRAVLAPERQR